MLAAYPALIFMPGVYLPLRDAWNDHLVTWLSGDNQFLLP